jgi:hypothetical protein
MVRANPAKAIAFAGFESQKYLHKRPDAQPDDEQTHHGH